jgi:acetoin utilization protein AcuB
MLHYKNNPMLNHQILVEGAATVTPLQRHETVADALSVMENEGLKALPVLSNDGIYLGLVFEDDLLNAEPQAPVGDLLYQASPISVQADSHFFTAAKMLVQHNLPFVPVLDADQHFRGTITSQQVLQQYYQLTNTQATGALLVLRVSPHDYSISQLARLVESNDAIITQIYTQLEANTGTMRITMRLNKLELSAIVATFQRYEYTIVYFEGIEAYENELVRNYNHLLSYLHI